MGINLKPKTTLGKWATGLIIAFFVFIAVFLILVASGQRGGDTFFSNPALTTPMLLAAISGVSALLTGAASIIISRERSLIVFLATALGLLVLVFSLGEVLFPH